MEFDHEVIKFLPSKCRDSYEVPSDDIGNIITKIGWEPLFSSMFLFQEPDENQRNMLVDFICNYDPTEKCGHFSGIPVVLTSKLVSQAFGFPDSELLKKVPIRGDKSFRCDLFTISRKFDSHGIPLRFITDPDIRDMLQRGNEMLMGRSFAHRAIKFGMLQAIWESLKHDVRYDWPGFMLANVNGHLHHVRRLLAASKPCTIVIGQQLLAILQAAAGMQAAPLALCREPAPCDDAMNILVDPVRQWDVPRESDIPVDPVEEDGPFDELLLLMKRTVMKLMVLRSSSSSEAEMMEEQQMENMRTMLRNLLVAQKQVKQQDNVSDDDKVRILGAELELLDAENKRIKAELGQVKARNASLEAENGDVEELGCKSPGLSSPRGKPRVLETGNERLMRHFVENEQAEAENGLEAENASLRAQNASLEAEVEELGRKCRVLETEQGRLVRYFVDKFRQLQDEWRDAHILVGEYQAKNLRLKRKVQELEGGSLPHETGN